jgi:AGZA family xanthine/uracil permease-like MFS transporter
VLERLFGLKARGTSVRTELIGGATTFVTMAYIVVVNPAILSFAGLPTGPSTVATILTAAFGCALMGLYANRPIAVAPYMGENAFIAFGLAALGVTWQQRLGAVFVSGVLFAALTLVGARTWLARSLSLSMKHAIAVGIGLFLALIGLYETGIVTSFVTGMPSAALMGPDGAHLRNPDVPLKLGNLADPPVLLAIGTLLLMVVLLHYKVRGALLIAMVVSGTVGFVAGLGQAPGEIFASPFDGEYALSAIAFKLDVPGVLRLAFLPVLLTLFLMSLLDTLGTLLGVGAAGGMLDDKGDFPDVEKPMLVDAVTCMFSGLVGTSTSGAYIESAAGIREGARTGLAALTTGALFLMCLIFLPLVSPLQQLRYAYAPALIVVGLQMIVSVRHVELDDLTELVPAFATIALMTFTYNIANGLTAGLVLYPLLKVLAGRARELGAGHYVLGALCLVYYVFGLPH